MADGNCVEVAFADRYVLVRDSKAVTDPQLKFSMKAWDSFIRNIKDGQTDL